MHRIPTLALMGFHLGLPALAGCADPSCEELGYADCDHDWGRSEFVVDNETGRELEVTTNPYGLEPRTTEVPAGQSVEVGFEAFTSVRGYFCFTDYDTDTDKCPLSVVDVDEGVTVYQGVRPAHWIEERVDDQENIYTLVITEPLLAEVAGQGRTPVMRAQNVQR